jgi:signal transduction histidine kinase
MSFVRRPNVLGSSAFCFVLIYSAVFGVSVLVLLAFIYWRTVSLIDRQATDTIEAEIRGLADQYSSRGLPGLVQTIEQRIKQRGNEDHVYLLTDPGLMPLAGNLESWPLQVGETSDWLALSFTKMDEEELLPHEVRARMFVLPGGFRLLVGHDVHERGKFRVIVLEALLWSLAATIALSLIGGMIVSRRMLQRVEDISRTAKRIMAGDLDQRVPGDGSGDEFDRLAGILNAMLDRIECLMAGMRLATDSLAHDLRRPLTRLKARTELALLQPPEPQRDRAALGDVLNQADSALTLFDNLLRIAMAQSGAAATELKLVDFAAVTRDATELYEPLAEEREIALRLTANGPAMIRGQPELLAQSVANLLDNALKYTPVGGSISVAVVVEAATIVFSVADSGPGIPDAERGRVLEPFVRLEESRSTPGSGLGLSLVAAVARLHDARLTLDDNAPGLRVTLSFAAA